MALWIVCSALLCGLLCGATAQELTVHGELRARYETLDGQFRRGLQGSDQAIFTRALIAAEADFGPIAMGAEIQDSRGFLDDEGSPVSASFVNTGNLLQAYLRLDTRGLLGASSAGTTVIGRQTVSISSKRQVERVSYANVIRSYTGIHHTSINERGDMLHLVAVVPVERLPRGQKAAINNDYAFDEEQWDRRLLGVHYRRSDALPGLVPGLWLEAFAYGLFEQDSDRFEGPNRNYVYPGFRVFRAKKRGQWDIDLEPSIRFGSRRETSDPADRDDLDVLASRVIAITGYTFDLPWEPRLALEWFWASGDENPTDGSYERYERLFGSRRTDLNNTSLHGPLTYANLNAPGARLEVKPSPVTDARIAYSAAYLASETDSFQIARLRDPLGQSGAFMGHTIDMRARYLPPGQPVVYEIGASAFLFGDFTENVPGGPDGARTLFGYLQATLTF